jgi:MoxR-like ATPase
VIPDAVAVTRGTREHPAVRQGSSVRGAIDSALVAHELLSLRGQDETSDEYAETFYDAMTVALSGRIRLDEAVETTPEVVLREIWEDRFVLEPARAEPG